MGVRRRGGSGNRMSYTAGQTTVDELKRLTGFDFFAGLDAAEQARIEAARAAAP